jgi:hypothetical protein
VEYDQVVLGREGEREGGRKTGLGVLLEVFT